MKGYIRLHNELDYSFYFYMIGFVFVVLLHV